MIHKENFSTNLRKISALLWRKIDKSENGISKIISRSCEGRRILLRASGWSGDTC